MTDPIDAMYDDRPFAADSALFSSAFKRANPPKAVMIRPDDEFLTELRFAPVTPPTDSPAMLYWLARMEENGRLSKAFRERAGA
jgi:hypothetical protein